MEVKETLQKAWAAVEDAGLPNHIHGAAFREAVRLLVPPPLPVETGAPTPAATLPGQVGKSGSTGNSGGADSSDRGSSGGDGTAITAPEGALLDKVAIQTGVPRAKLEELVHLDDGVLKVSIPGIKLGRNNADKTRAIAQIITIVRGFGLNETETSVELVRTEAQRLKCYDPANFSSHIKALTGYLITGSGTNRRIRAKAAGIQSFPAFVDGLLSVS